MSMATSFVVLPAIDLRAGRVVRLERGDFERETAFSDDPVEVARRFAEEGATWLHVVDLDGARTGRPAHAAVVAEIVAAMPSTVHVEVAGGLRTGSVVSRALEAGAARVVIGTQAITDPEFARRLVEAHGADRIAVAIDVRDGEALTHGWREGAPGVAVEGVMCDLAEAGIRTFEVTAIERDGLSRGPDLGLYEHLMGRAAGGIVASGGIRSTSDIATVRDLGCAGAIVGRALYEGRLSVAAAVRAERA
jgi:phosphoribosylformimino-5-aminoimidazole carboxamide ribotide isomerase